MTTGIALWGSNNSSPKHPSFSNNVYGFWKVVKKTIYFKQFTLIYTHKSFNEVK